MANYTTNPSQKVKEKFSASLTSGAEIGPGPAIPKPAKTTRAALPPPMSIDQIDSYFEPIRKEIQALPPPEAAPVPPKTPALTAFLSVLAGNLGASLTRNPAQAEQIQNYLLEKDKERKAAEAQNFASRVAFDQNRRNQLISIRAQALDTALQEAIKSGDSERAAKIAENQLKLGADLKATVETPAETAGKIAVTQEEGRQQRMTLAAAARLAIEKETEGTGKPLTPQQFQKAIDDVNKNKELTTEEHGLLGNLWRMLVGGDNKINKRDMLMGTYVTGFLGGETSVQDTSRRRLLSMIYAQLGLLKKYKDPKTPFSPEDEAKVRKALTDVGLDPDEVFNWKP